MTEALIAIGGTKWRGAYNLYFYIRKYKRKAGYRVELKRRHFTGRWFTEAKGAVLTIEEAVQWLKKNSWLAVNEKEVLHEIKEKLGVE